MSSLQAISRSSVLPALALLTASHLFSPFLEAAPGPPSSYSLTDHGLLTPAKNQGAMGTCWAFATTTTFQSAVLRAGLVAGRTDPRLDFSVWHLATSNGNYSVYKPQRNEEGDLDYPGWGGFNEDSTGYWTRGIGSWAIDKEYTPRPAGGGPVLISANAKNRYPREAAARHADLLPYAPPALQPSAGFGLKESVTFQWDRQLSSLGAFQTELKEALLKYGAVSMTMHADDKFNGLNDENPAFMLTGKDLKVDPNHMVTLSGWDDDKVFTIDGKTYTGGWFVQNSWGSNWGVTDEATGERGYFWIPFADRSLSNLKRGVALVVRNNEYRDGVRVYSPVVMQNQIFAPYRGDEEVYVAGFREGTQTLALQRLRAPRGPSRTTLAAIGLWQPDPGMTVDIYVYRKWGKNGPIGAPVAKIENYTMNPDGIGGYQEIDLDAPVDFAMGAPIYVLVDYGDGYSYPVAIDIRTPLNLAGPLDLTGLSWISSDGQNWYDLSNSLEIAGVMFMKGISIFVELPGTGTVLDLMQTSGFATVPSLQFTPSSELYLNGPLTVTSGRFHTSGYAELRGWEAVVPGSFVSEGPGHLVISSEVTVGKNARVEGRQLSVGNRFTIGGGLEVLSRLSVIGPRRDWDSVGALSAASVAVDRSAQIEVERGASLFLTGRDSLKRIAPGETAGGLVTNRGWLGGIGVLTANVRNLGTVAPGFSPGRLVIRGNYDHLRSADYQWEAGRSGYDSLVVQGDARLRGTLSLSGYNGYQLEYGDRYRGILSADRLTGEFRKVNAPDGLRGRLLEKNDSLTLLIAPESYTQLASTPNEYRAAKALDHFIPETKGDRQTVSIALDELRADQYGQAFSAIMPGFYQGVAAMGVNLAVGQMSHLTQRLDGLRMGAGAGFSAEGIEVVTVASEGKRTVSAGDASKEQIVVETSEERWSVWTQATGIFGKTYSVTDVPSLRYDSGGFLVGADYRWSDRFTTGLFAGYQGAEARYDGDGRARSNGANVGVYGSWGGESGFHASAMAAIGQTHYDVRREIRFGSIDRTAESKFDAWNGSAMVEAGYAFRLGAFRVGPIASVQASRMDADDFTERNAKSLNLKVTGFDNDSLQSNLGARIALPVAVADDLVIVPEFRAVWNHEFLQSDGAYQATLAGGSGPSFRYEQTAPSRDSLTLGTGLTAQFGSRWNASAYYQVNCASSQSVTHSVSLAAGLSF